MRKYRSVRLAALLALAATAPAAAQVINTCRFEDAVNWLGRTPEERVITFPTAAYNPPCVLIEAGETVTWSGNFQHHPLAGGYYKDGGPQEGNPIPTVTSGTTPVVVEFPEAGAWGYYCIAHQPPMAGAVFVALFADGFESGDPCDWSAVSDPFCP